MECTVWRYWNGLFCLWKAPASNRTFVYRHDVMRVSVFCCQCDQLTDHRYSVSRDTVLYPVVAVSILKVNNLKIKNSMNNSPAIRALFSTINVKRIGGNDSLFIRE